MWFFLGFQLICLQNYRLDFSIKVSVVNFICVEGYSINIFQKFLAAFVLSWAKTGKSTICCGFSLLTNLISLKALAGFTLSRSHKIFPSFNKMIQKITRGLRTLLRSPDILMISRIAEINGGIHFGGERLKTRLKTLFLFFKLFAKIDQKICNWAKRMPELAGRLVGIFGPYFCEIISNCRVLLLF